MARKQKAVKWVLISLAVLCGLLSAVVVLAIVFLQIAPYFLKPKVDREIAAIKARGEPVTMADLAGQKIPDAENGAVIYERIFREMDKPQVRKDLQTVGSFCVKQVRAKDPMAWHKTRSDIEREHYLIPLIEQAASKPKCQFPVNWEEGLLSARSPHLAKLRRIALLLSANSVASARDGNMAEAARSLGIGFKVCESLRDEADLTTLFTRLTVVKITSDALVESMKYGAFAEGDARQLTDILERIDIDAGLAAGLRAERAMAIRLFDTARDRQHATMRWVTDGSVDMVHSPKEHTSAWWRCYTYADELYYLRTMDKYVQCARLPYREISARSLFPEPQEFPCYTLLTVVCLPSNRVFGRDQTKALIAGDEILLAVEAYKTRFGEYPATLDQLRGKLGWTVPRDVFSGRDFIYKLKDKGFLFYSIGPNLKDDGGKEPPEDDKDKGDIVWRMDH
jgi:hypothetical protein